MADIYLDSAATGLNDGTSEANAYTTLDAAITGTTAGTDIIWMKNTHSESFSSSKTFVLNANNVPYEIISHSGSKVYSKSTTDNFIVTTGSLTLDGSVSSYGVIYKAQTFIKTILLLSETYLSNDDTFKIGDASYFLISGSTTDGIIKIINPTFDCTQDSASTSEGIIDSGSSVDIYNPTFLNATNRTAVVHKSSRYPIRIYGGDLSQFSYIKHTVAGANIQSLPIEVFGAKLKSSVVAHSTTNNTNIHSIVKLYNSDDATGNDQELYSYSNSSFGIASRDTSVYRTGGASRSSTGFSTKYVTEAKASKFRTLSAFPLVADVSTTGSKTFTVSLIHDSTTNLQDDEVWMELSYLANSGDTQVTISSTAWNASDPTNTPADLSASTETWTESMTNPNKQKISITATVNQTGPALLKIYAGIPSKTFYLCPKVDIA